MRKRVAAFIAAFAALALVAAAEPTQPVGTASTQLTAAELSVTGVESPVNGLTLLDVRTFASTDADTARNAAGVPFSTATISPLKLNGEDLVDPVTVRSDGDTSQETATINESVGVASVALNPLGMSATAGADTANATVNAATAQVTALSDALGIELNHVPGLASVDANRATATSGIAVSGVDLSLGELLPVELGDLPLDALLDLANLLSSQLDVTGLDLTALNDAIAAVEAELADIQGAFDAYSEDVQAVQDAVTAANTAAGNLVDGLTDVASLETDLAAATLLHDDAVALDETVDALTSVASLTQTLLDDINDAIARNNALVDSDTDGDFDTNDEYGGCSGCQYIDPLPTDLADLLLLSDPLGTVQGTVDALVASSGSLETYLGQALTAAQTFQSAITTLQSAIAELEAALDAIVTAVTEGDLAGLLDTLLLEVNDILDLVEDLAGDLDLANLLDVDPIGVTVGATATADSATSSITCGGGGVSVAGVEVVSNVDACDAVSGASDTLAGALATVDSVLETLTTADVPTPSLELFVEQRESSGQDGAYRTATAGITALILDLPSVDLDALVGDTLEGLLGQLANADISALIGSLGDLLGTLDLGEPLQVVTDQLSTTIADLETEADTIETTYLDPLLSDVLDIESLVGEELRDVLLGAIPDTGLMTPGVNLEVDPVSTAEFAPGTTGAAPPPSDDPTTEPAPAPEPEPSLPATGGGLALLGALALAGGLALRRRR